ncbi:TlpA disulfide reductase family protein [Pedobacter psychrodurus]|uniref:TlpA family protein disulfide reductase n=1 Tax=Pedobacter psychrodurus TaxID=2530456 RepID=UPI00292F9452|nr:TlpA disulfide reductase family protein [Pedobacter psychrodurus]
MKVKQKILVVILSIILEMAISPLRLFGLGYSTVIGLFCYFIFVLLIWRLNKSKLPVKGIAFHAAMGILLIQLPIRVFSFSTSLSTLPDMLFHILGTVTAYIYICSLRTGKIAVLISSFLITFWMVKFGYPLWQNLMNYNSLDGKVSESNKMTVTGYERNGALLTTTELKSDYIMLDYWFSGCKPCFDEFPKFQKAYDNPRYKGRVNIMAVNIPMKSDTINQAFQALESRNYTFKNIIEKKTNNAGLVEVKICPTTIILDRNRRIIFMGELKNAEKYLEELLD